MSLVIITLLIVLQNTRSQNCVAYDTPEKCFQMSAAFANQVRGVGGRLRPGSVCIVCNKKREGMEREAKKLCQSCADIFRSSFWSECESYTIGESLDSARTYSKSSFDSSLLGRRNELCDLRPRTDPSPPNTGKPCNEWDDIDVVCEEGGRVLKREVDDTLIGEVLRVFIG